MIRYRCITHRAADERAAPGRWRWEPALDGLTCMVPGCERRADAVGENEQGRGEPDDRQPRRASDRWTQEQANAWRKRMRRQARNDARRLARLGGAT